MRLKVEDTRLRPYTIAFKSKYQTQPSEKGKCNTMPDPTPPAQGQPPRQGLGIAAVAASTILFSWGFPLVKAMGLPGPTIAFFRLVLGASFLVVVALATGARRPPALGMTALAGVFFGVHQLLYIAATQRTSISIVTVVGAMQSLVVAIIGQRTTGEKLGPRHYLWSGMAAVGVGIVVLASRGDRSRSLMGDLLSVVNLFSYVGFFLASKRARQLGTPALSLTAGSLTVATVVVLPAMFLVGWRLPTNQQWAYLAILAWGPGNGHILVNWAHKHVSAALSSLIICVVPLLASIWATLLFGESLGIFHVVGMALVGIAIEGARRTEAASTLKTTSVLGADR